MNSLLVFYVESAKLLLLFKTRCLACLKSAIRKKLHISSWVCNEQAHAECAGLNGRALDLIHDSKRPRYLCKK